MFARLFTILIFIALLSCQEKGDTLEDVLNMNKSGSVVEIPPSYRIKILFDSNNQNVGDAPAVVGVALELKAALFDHNNDYVRDVEASWSLSGNAFPASDLSITNSGINSTFTPSTIGQTIIVASIIDEGGENISTTTDATGTITVTATQVPTSMLITGGDNQTASINNNLTNPLQVRVLDAYGQPIQGESVTFSVTQGSGAIIGTNPVLTDVNGYASVIVKLGTMAGPDGNKYRATLDNNTAIYSDFTANATAGAIDHVTFTTQPDLLYANTAFVIQPIIAIKDAYENTVNIGGSVTMSLQSGSGILSGTKTITVTNGTATFSNLEYDTAESGVVLRATYSSVTGDSNSLIVNSPPPGACTVNDGYFRTALGGCMDMDTGLVWSARSPLDRNYHTAIWDSTLPGSSPPDADDYGRTNDYTHAQDILVQDTNTQAYCHDLSQGGYTDWRVPNVNEYQSARLKEIGLGVNYLPSMGTYVLTSSQHGTFNSVVHYPGGSVANGGFTSGYAVLCVRGKWKNDTKIEYLSGPARLGGGYTTTTPFILRIQDEDGNSVHKEGTSVTISTDFGTLGGTTTVQTDNNGIARFDSINLDSTSVGNATLTFTAAGYAPVTTVVKTGSSKHICKVDDSAFATIDGGCKDLTSGKVWSSISNITLNWYQVIWDSTLSGNSAQDGNDAGPNDYGNSPGAYTDNNISNFCHDLIESGYSDWRVPTVDEFAQARLNGADINLGVSTGAYYWSSTSAYSNVICSTQNIPNYACPYRFSDGASYRMIKTNNYYGICIREP